MKKSTLIPNISVNKIADHNKHKSILLDYFSRQSNKFESISNTDWNENENKDREWIHYFKDNVFNQIQNHLLNERLAKEVIIHNIWFQQYKQNDYHGWHTHPLTQFTNIYYVELPDGEKTELYGEVDIDIKEGDILSFPAYIFHRSKPNISNQRKTVISFNTSYDILNIDILNSSFGSLKH